MHCVVWTMHCEVCEQGTMYNGLLLLCSSATRSLVEPCCLDTKVNGLNRKVVFVAIV